MKRSTFMSRLDSPFADTCFETPSYREMRRDLFAGKRLDSGAKDICLYMYENKSCTPGWSRPPAFKLLTELVCNLSLLKWRWSFQLPCCDRVGGQTLPTSPANPLLYFFISLYTDAKHRWRQTCQISELNKEKSNTSDEVNVFQACRGRINCKDP